MEQLVQFELHCDEFGRSKRCVIHLEAISARSWNWARYLSTKISIDPILRVAHSCTFRTRKYHISSHLLQ